MTNSLALRSLEQIISINTEPIVALLALEYGDLVSGSRAIQIRGIALQVSAVNVTATSTAASASSITVPNQNGYFSVAVSLGFSGPHGFVIIEAREAQTSGGAVAMFDRCVAQIGNAGGLALPGPTISNIDVGRLKYLAGTPDRLIVSRTFVQLNVPPSFENVKDDTSTYVSSESDSTYVFSESDSLSGLTPGTYTVDKPDSVAQSGKAPGPHTYGKTDQTGKLVQIDRGQFKKLHESLSTLSQMVNDNKMTVNEYYRALGDSFSGAAKEAIKTVPASTTTKTSSKKKASSKKSTATIAKQFTADDFGPEKPFSTYPFPSEMWANVIRKSQRVGVLFLDRLRLQPAGLVIGEPIYKLCLSPGEEVQLRQSCETRKRVSLQEIRDRETEDTLTLSSTLSTDLTTTIADNTSFQSQISLGGGLNGTIPKTPIGVSVSAGSTATSAHTNSVTETAQFHNETSSQSMARLRAQHKTTLEISSEETTGYTTTRTLRNTNQQRSQIHTFFKLYRKEKITLERYEAQLCARLEVLDPARETRAAFLNNFHKINPNNKANWDLPDFGDQPRNKDITFYQPADQPADHHLGGTHNRWGLGFTNVGVYLDPPPGYELIDLPLITMRDVTIFTANSGLAGVDGAHSYTGTVTREAYHENIGLLPIYTRHSGKIKWRTKPQPMNANMSLVLDVNYPFTMKGRPPVFPFIELSQQITSVTLNISATFGAGATLQQHRLDKILRRKREAIANFDPSSVYALGAAARADYPGSVMDRIISENFGDVSTDQMQEFNRAFSLDDVIIENVPYWGTREASEDHFELKYMLEELPKGVVTDEILTPELTGSMAVVYLPIRHGMEDVALFFLRELDIKQRKALVADFYDLRESRFGAARPANTSTATTVEAPTSVGGTPAGAQAWATNWETRMRDFEVLAEWSDLTPTDGLHIETQLSATTVADEAAKARLERLE